MKSRFWSNVASVLSGTAVAQFIPIIGSLALARLYAPAAFGAYSVWLGFVLIFAVIATLRLEMALVIVKDGEPRKEAAQLVLATILLIGSLGGAVLATAWMTGLLLTDIKTPSLFAAVVIAAMLAAASDSWQNWAASSGQYKALIRIRISQAFAIIVGQLSAATLAKTTEMLVLGHVAGLAFGLAVAVAHLPVTPPPLAGLFGRLWSFWGTHRRFPIFALPADAINTISAQLPLLVISSRFGAESAGLLALTMRVLGAPIGLLGRSVLDVFRRHAAEAFRQTGSCRPEYLSTLKVLTVGSMALIIGVILFARPIFDLAFGSKWEVSADMAMWLVPLFALRFVASPLSYIFYIVGKQNVDLVWQLVLLCIVTGALWLPDSLEYSLYAYTYGYSAMYLVYLAMSYRYSRGQTA